MPNLAPDMACITPEQIDAYWRDGYTCVRGLFAPDEVAPWLEHTRALASGATAPPPAMQLVRDVMVAGQWVVQQKHHAAEEAAASRYKDAVRHLLP